MVCKLLPINPLFWLYLTTNREYFEEMLTPSLNSLVLIDTIGLAGVGSTYSLRPQSIARILNQIEYIALCRSYFLDISVADSALREIINRLSHGLSCVLFPHLLVKQEASILKINMFRFQNSDISWHLQIRI